MVGITPAEAGAASGLFNMMRNLGGTIGTAAIETGILDDQFMRRVLMDDLIAITGRHFECLEHRLMGGIQELGDLGRTAALDHVESKKRHVNSPEDL
jgi:hypothetical protein